MRKELFSFGLNLVPWRVPNHCIEPRSLATIQRKEQFWKRQLPAERTEILALRYCPCSLIARILSHCLKLLNLSHPLISEQTVGRRISGIQKSPADSEIMSIQEGLQFLLHREVGELLVLEIARLFGFQTLDLIEKREGPLDPKIELVAAEIQLKQALLRRIAR